MDSRKVLAGAYLAWYIATSLLIAIVLAWAMQDQAWWKSIPVLLAFISLVYSSGCFFCRRARQALRGE